MSGDHTAVLRRILLAVDEAMTAEGVAARTRRRVANRLLYGTPVNPLRPDRSRMIRPGDALLFEWEYTGELPPDLEAMKKVRGPFVIENRIDGRWVPITEAADGWDTARRVD